MSDDKILKIDSTVRDSLEFYDKNQEKYNKFLNKVKYIKFVDNNNVVDDIIFYDEHKKILLESSYEILGVFLPKSKLWKWSWSIPIISKKYTFISRKILEWAFNLDHIKELPLKADLTNSKIKITNELELDIHIALSSYIGKQPLVFKFYNKVYDKTKFKEGEKTNSEFSESELVPSKNSRTSKKIKSINNSETNLDDNIFEYNTNEDNNNNYMAIYLFILDHKNITI